MPEIDNDVQILLAAGAAAVEPVEHRAEIDPPDLLTAIVPDGYRIDSFNVANALAPYREAPSRVRGTAVLTDTLSWLAYFGKHGTDTSEVYGDVKASSVTAILNAPEATGSLDRAAWGDHRAVLQLEHAPAWLAWRKLDGQLVSQEQFAEHLEDRSPDLRTPDAATMLELAQSFQATKGVQFESGSALASGQRRLQYLESIEGKAGNRGQLDIPAQIRIQVQVWRGVAIAVPMTARFRFRIGREGLRLAYVLDQVDDVLDAAWSSLLGELTDALPVPVLAGKAPSYA
jgi:uncharacterized protein YfdQ (DUF2303 family)